MRFLKKSHCAGSISMYLVAQNTLHIMPTTCSDAQPLDEHEKQLPLEMSCNSLDGFLRLWYKYELRKFSHYVIFTFCVINMFPSDSGDLY